MQNPFMFPRSLILVATILCLSLGTSYGQKALAPAGAGLEGPDLVELSLGYNYIRLGNAYPETRNLNGLEFSAFVNATSWLAVGGEFIAGFGTHSFTVSFFTKADIDSQRYVYVFGPRVTIWHNRQFRVFAEALAGGALADAQLSVQSPFSSISRNVSDDSFATALGAGFDWRIAKHVSWRIVQADYLGTDFGNHWQNNFTASTSIAYSFGRR
jgi:hypothetical protein